MLNMEQLYSLRLSMLLVCLVVSWLYVYGQCILLTPSNQYDNRKLIHCVIGILNKYFTEQNELTYVKINPSDYRLLKAIHTTTNFTLINRLPTEQMFVINNGYLVHSTNASDFIEYFSYIIQEPTWNPLTRFLIVTGTLQEVDLNLIFDELLRQHVTNALVVSGSEDPELYSYNPFDNYACGKYYDTIINYGLCSQTTQNLYPNKLVTGLRNCTFSASLTHRPPYTIDPWKTKYKKTLLGTEEYIIKLLSKIENFTVNFNYNQYSEVFSTIYPNMTAVGPLKMLQKNVCDVMFGAMMVTTGSEAFTYLCGYHDFSDELRFAVKSSPLVPIAEYIYLEFELDVWALLGVSLVIYSMILFFLMRSSDKGKIVLFLLDNLLLHGRHIRARWSVKCVLIMWVWFAYLINTFYQTNLYSFTIHPSLDYQIQNEGDIKEYNLKSCISRELKKSLFLETDNPYASENNKECKTTTQSMDTVSRNEEVFTILPNYFYLYNEGKYSSKWGEPLVYYFPKPYAKLLFGYFFYKGFPITRRLKLNALRMRESGLTEKNLQDHYYIRKLKQKIHKKTFEPHFVVPWYVYFPGVVMASVTFVIEVVFKRKFILNNVRNVHKSP